MLVAGVDGIKGGWVFVLKEGAQITLGAAASFLELLQLLAKVDVVTVDIPIGLLEAACPGGRECDRQARKKVGPGKASSIFSPPCRGALVAIDSYTRANEINRDSSAFRLGISRQAHALFPKLDEVDRALTPSLQGRVVEVHPEVSFAALREAVAAREKGFDPLAPKKKPKGREQRMELLDRLKGSSGFGDIEKLVTLGRTLGARPDDTLDACVAAWTAERIARQEAVCLPSKPPLDERGLRMEIRY